MKHWTEDRYPIIRYARWRVRAINGNAALLGCGFHPLSAPTLTGHAVLVAIRVSEGDAAANSYIQTTECANTSLREPHPRPSTIRL